MLIVCGFYHESCVAITIWKRGINLFLKGRGGVIQARRQYRQRLSLLVAPLYLVEILRPVPYHPACMNVSHIQERDEELLTFQVPASSNCARLSPSLANSPN